MLIEVASGHSLQFIRDGSFDLSDDKVYLLFDVSTESVFVATGKKTPVNLRFFGSKTASQYAKQIGFNYYLVSRLEDEGIFEQALDRYRKWAKSRKKVPSKLKSIKLDSIGPIDSDFNASSKNLPKSNSSQISDVLDKIKTLEPLSSKILDYVLVNSTLFAVEYTKNEYIYSEQVDIPTGIFSVVNYTPRMYVEDSKVLAVEFWRNNA